MRIRQNGARYVAAIALLIGCRPSPWSTTNDGTQFAVYRNAGEMYPVIVKVCSKKSLYVLNVLSAKNAELSVQENKTIRAEGGCVELEKTFGVWVQKANATTGVPATGTYAIDGVQATVGVDQQSSIDVACHAFADSSRYWWGRCEVQERIENRRICFDEGFARTGNGKSLFNPQLLFAIPSVPKSSDAAPYSDDLHFNPLAEGGCRDLMHTPTTTFLIRNDSTNPKPTALRLRVFPIEIRAK